MRATPRCAAQLRTPPHRTAPHRTAPRRAAPGKTYNMNVIHERAPAELFAAIAANAHAEAAAAPPPPSIGLISYELVGVRVWGWFGSALTLTLNLTLTLTLTLAPTLTLTRYELVGKRSYDLLSDDKGEVQLRADAKGRIQASRPAAHPPITWWPQSCILGRTTAAAGPAWPCRARLCTCTTRLPDPPTAHAARRAGERQRGAARRLGGAAGRAATRRRRTARDRVDWRQRAVVALARRVPALPVQRRQAGQG